MSPLASTDAGVSGVTLPVVGVIESPSQWISHSFDLILDVPLINSVVDKSANPTVTANNKISNKSIFLCFLFSY